MDNATEPILGYQVYQKSLGDCVNEVVQWIEKGDRCEWLTCLNPYSYVVAVDDDTFSRSFDDAKWVVPDGIGVVIASKWLKGHIRQRMTGADVFFSLQERLNALGGKSVFFIGSTEGTLAAISEKFKKDYPNVRLAGVYSPPFKPEFTPDDIDQMIEAINASGADVLWVGMTAPKQEKWIFQNRAKLKVKFAGAIGAVFDFYTGKVRRAHPFFQKMGLEWLVRLVREPRRLWRRYLVSSPLFFWHLFLGKSRKTTVKP